MKFHELASIFPMMERDEFVSLKDDINTQGLMEPIWTWEGKIIDGRNRYNACRELGIEPKYREWNGDGTLISVIVGLNLHRRHLNSSQRAFIALAIEAELAKEAKKRQGKRTDLEIVLISNGVDTFTCNICSEVFVKQVWHCPGCDHHWTMDVEGCKNCHEFKKPNIVEIIPQGEEGKSRVQAAQIVGTNARYIQDAKKIAAEAPEKAEEIKAGKKTIPEVKKEIIKEKREEKIEKIREKIDSEGKIPIDGKYDVIIIDPPWPYGTKYDSETRRAASPYPEMSITDIENIKIPDKNDSVLWLWTTHKFMRESFQILDFWCYREVAILTWVKDKMGLGSWLRSQSEFCIMAVKGKPIINLKNQTTVVYGKMREHSRKPDEFYKMVRSLCVGRIFEMFSREKRVEIDGTSGIEADKFNG